MNTWARFWQVDFHVHTPGSADADEKHYGTAHDIVRAALDAGLDAIVVADHNTADWCDRMATAAGGTPLIVLPGVEVSTTEGHLLGVWEEGTSSAVIEDLLIALGISRPSFGKLDIATTHGFSQVAEDIAKAGGLAIPAHVEKDKGLLKLEVKARVKAVLECPSIAAVEICSADTQETVRRAAGRPLACVHGSDTWDPALSTHAQSGIGARRTWIKAARPDLVGLCHAFADPDLRISLVPPPAATHPVIEQIRISGGFLDGEQFDLSPDLNCLLGGTGAGKSLVLEALRYCLEQQVDAIAFPAIRAEVNSRLEFACTTAGVVSVLARIGDTRYRIERAYAPLSSVAPTVSQLVGEQWVELDESPQSLIPLAAFSQGEVLEYARQPVVRMSLVDAGLDLTELEDQIVDTELALRENSKRLLEADAEVQRLTEEQDKISELTSHIDSLSELFAKDVVQEQDKWQQEERQLKSLVTKVAALAAPTVDVPRTNPSHKVDANKAVFEEAVAILETMRQRVGDATTEITQAVNDAAASLNALQTRWRVGQEEFTAKLNAELEKIAPDSTLRVLRFRLATLQAELAGAKQAGEELTETAQPELTDATAERERLLDELNALRGERRNRRRERVAQLNKGMAGAVKLDIPAAGDHRTYLEALKGLKVGSHVREQVLEAIASQIHPITFGRSLWDQDTAPLVRADAGIDPANLARLLTNVLDRELWAALLDIQTIECPDILTVKFKKPDDNSYTPIEQLAHGQKCTAILVILLADGTTPVVVDQPEDALHAPWMEEYLVPRLRELRGTRQYLFATRSSAIVVSADAEQIITMRASAGRGEVEHTGSLERHDLNERVVYHVEGGLDPFRRRRTKLNV
jgi:hypothetical protein